MSIQNQTNFVNFCAKPSQKLKAKGFTLLELMIVVAIIAILAAIAIPSYESYIRKSRARTATADLAALSLNIENEYRRKLQYPTPRKLEYSTESPSELKDAYPNWDPAMKDYFDYAVTFEDDAYELKATGKANLAGCDLEVRVPTTLASATLERKAQGNCGFSTW